MFYERSYADVENCANLRCFHHSTVDQQFVFVQNTIILQSRKKFCKMLNNFFMRPSQKLRLWRKGLLVVPHIVHNFSSRVDSAWKSYRCWKFHRITILHKIQLNSVDTITKTHVFWKFGYFETFFNSSYFKISRNMCRDPRYFMLLKHLKYSL